MMVEEAAQAIHGAICEESLEDHMDPDWPGRCVKAVEALASHLTRTITTVEELEALGHGAVIRSEHRHYWVAHKEDGMGADQGWAVAGGGAVTSRELTSWLPATVLHE